MNSADISSGKHFTFFFDSLVHVSFSCWYLFLLPINHSLQQLSETILVLLTSRKRQASLQNEIQSDSTVKKSAEDMTIGSGSTDTEYVLEDNASTETEGKIKRKAAGEVKVKGKTQRATSQQNSKKKYEKKPSNNVRYNSTLPHLPQYGVKRERCKFESCGSAKTNIFCTICNVHLCTNKKNCFKKFHELEIPALAIT